MTNYKYNKNLYDKMIAMKKSLIDRIKEIKKNNPGKFDHLPDPEYGTALRNYTREEIKDFEEKMRKRFAYKNISLR